MNTVRINDTVSFIECSDDPLSADIGMIRQGTQMWLFDVGADERSIAGITENCNVVLSHFHRDHTGNLEKLNVGTLYVSAVTAKHTHWGTIVSEPMRIGNLSIFPIPSSHCKGSLGLQVGDEYAFVGDALYPKEQGGMAVYNSYLLKEEIKLLKSLPVPYLLVSHYPGMVRSRPEVIAELEGVLCAWDKKSPVIPVPYPEDNS